VGVEALNVGTPRRSGPFDTAKVLGHVERLSYPRRVGTSQERRAARYILHAFASLGLVGRREPFPVPYGARELGVRLTFAASAAAVLLGACIVESRPVVAAACWVAAGALVNLPWRIARGFGARRTTRMMSQNLVATLPDPVAGVPARVVFMAHYDSKSQLLPTGIRVALVVAATALCGLLAALGLVAAAAPLGAMRGPLAVGIATALIAILTVLAANLTGNRSPGALDNGTGVGTLLELARTWRPEPDAPVEVYWVATGSEEVGLDGARHFLRQHEDWWREKPTLLINMDTLGVGDRIYLAGEPGARRLACETADALGLPWARLRVIGAGMDHEPFAARGLTAMSLLGDVVGCSMKCHSPRDVPGLVDLQALGRAGRLAAHLAWNWAERHQAGYEGQSPSAGPGVGHRPFGMGRSWWSRLRVGRGPEGLPERVRTDPALVGPR
jgi:hypothetical protein